MTFELPELSYEFGALEPYIDAKTMEIHHDKHHATYVQKLNNALLKYPDLADMQIEEILVDLDSIPEDIRTAVRNNGGGYYNHSLFWEMMSPDGGSPDGKVFDAIEEEFGSFEEFKKQFSEMALGVFGSGWTWLVVSDSGLKIMKTGIQDNPISAGMIPILGLDVWEHAYYLNYQNRRADYVEAFWNVINWEYVNELYERAI